MAMFVYQRINHHLLKPHGESLKKHVKPSDVFAEIGQVREDIDLHTSIPNLSRQAQGLPWRRGATWDGHGINMG